MPSLTQTNPKTKNQGDDPATRALKGVAPSDYGAVSRSGKLQVLAEVLPRWERQGHRVLLFAQTRQTLDILERLVKGRGWRYLRMDGATSVGARPALIDRFNGDESVFAFLLTTRTGGLGISLTGADRVVRFFCFMLCMGWWDTAGALNSTNQMGQPNMKNRCSSIRTGTRRRTCRRGSGRGGWGRSGQ